MPSLRGTASIMALTGALGAAVGATSAVRAEPPGAVFSMAQSESKLGFGLRAIVTDPLPMLDFHAVLDGGEHLDWEVHLATAGVFSFVDFGARFPFYSSPAFSIGARADLSTVATFAAAGGSSLGGIFLFGVTPGLVVSVGGDWIQLSLGSDFPVFFLAGGNTALGGGPQDRVDTALVTPAVPNVTVEIELGDDLFLYLRGEVYLRLSSQGGHFGPLIYAGVAVL